MLSQPLQLQILHRILHLHPFRRNPLPRLRNLEIKAFLRRPTQILDRLQLDEAVISRVGAMEIEWFFERDGRVGDDAGVAEVVVRSGVEHERVDKDDLVPPCGSALPRISSKSSI